MDILEIHEKLIDEHRSYTSSFDAARGKRLADHAEPRPTSGEELSRPWPTSPNFERPGGAASKLVCAGVMHSECELSFRLDGHPDRLRLAGAALASPICASAMLARADWMSKLHRRLDDRTDEQRVQWAKEASDG